MNVQTTMEDVHKHVRTQLDRITALVRLDIISIPIFVLVMTLMSVSWVIHVQENALTSLGHITVDVQKDKLMIRLLTDVLLQIIVPAILASISVSVIALPISVIACLGMF